MHLPQTASLFPRFIGFCFKPGRKLQRVLVESAGRIAFCIDGLYGFSPQIASDGIS